MRRLPPRREASPQHPRAGRRQVVLGDAYQAGELVAARVAGVRGEEEADMRIMRGAPFTSRGGERVLEERVRGSA